MELGQMLNSVGEEELNPIPEEKGCPKDMKECADGTTVKRNPSKKCEFDDCPDIRINEVKMEKGILGLDYKFILLGLGVLVAGYFIMKKK